MNYKQRMKARIRDHILQFAEVLVLDSGMNPVYSTELDIDDSLHGILDSRFAASAVPPGFLGTYVSLDHEQREHTVCFVFNGADSEPGVSVAPLTGRTGRITAMAREGTFSSGAIVHDYDPVPLPDEEYYRTCRRYIGTEPLYCHATGTVVRDGRRVLLQKRTDNGLWGLPGGALEAGERVHDGAIREVREETGYEVEIGPLLSISTEPENFVVYPNEDRVRFYAFLFSARVTGGAPFIDGEETADLRWFDSGALPPNLDPYLVRHVADLDNTGVSVY